MKPYIFVGNACICGIALTEKGHHTRIIELYVLFLNTRFVRVKFLCVFSRKECQEREQQFMEDKKRKKEDKRKRETSQKVKVIRQE